MPHITTDNVSDLIAIDDWWRILLCHCMLPVLGLFKIGLEVSIIPGTMFFNQPNFAESGVIIREGPSLTVFSQPGRAQQSNCG
jgi:hypothetical protein